MEATQMRNTRQRLRRLLLPNEMPDIFFTWGCAFLAIFVEAGR
jgi:hypothetical protein